MKTMTVRDVVLEVPQATGVFERLRIDYCCGGQVPLSEACANAGFELESVVKLLEDAAHTKRPKALDFQTCSLTDLITYIVDKHHTFTLEEMLRLGALGEKVLAAHVENHPELSLVNKSMKELFADLSPHMFKEEQILFPYIVSLEKSLTSGQAVHRAPFGTVNNPVNMMMMEHEGAGEILKNLRKLSLNYSTPTDGCISYRSFYRGLEAFERDLHQHIHLENNILFPRAIELENSVES